MSLIVVNKAVPEIKPVAAIPAVPETFDIHGLTAEQLAMLTILVGQMLDALGIDNGTALRAMRGNNRLKSLPPIEFDGHVEFVLSKR